MQDKPWIDEELKEGEEALPRLKEGELEKASKIVQGKNRSGLRWVPSKSCSGLDKRDERRNCRVLGESGTQWHMAATSLHDDVLLDSEECHE